MLQVECPFHQKRQGNALNGLLRMPVGRVASREGYQYAVIVLVTSFSSVKSDEVICL